MAQPGGSLHRSDTAIIGEQPDGRRTWPRPPPLTEADHAKAAFYADAQPNWADGGIKRRHHQVQGNKSGSVRIDTVPSIPAALWRIAPNRAGENVMHRYEQVEHPSNKAVTLTFGTNGGRDRGGVTGPTEIIVGQQMVVQPGSLTPTKAFAMAEELADQLGLPLVVVDPNGIWNPVWGELYRSTRPALAA